MSLSGTPPELLLQICCLAVEHNNFASLRLVNKSFNVIIQSHASLLTRELYQRSDIADRTRALYGEVQSLASVASEPETLNELLSLHSHIHAGMSCTEALKTRYLRALFFTLNLPTPLPGSLEGMHIFSIVHQAVHKTIKAGGVASKSRVFIPETVTHSIKPILLSVDFTSFLKNQITSSELELLMNTVSLCVDELEAHGYLPSLREESGAREKSDEHWQSRELKRTVLQENVLWKGPVWVKKTLQDPGISRNDDAPGSELSHEEQWQGTYADAARLGANGLAKILWRERQRKLADGDKSQRVASAVSPWAQISAGVWRGSSGEM